MTLDELIELREQVNLASMELARAERGLQVATEAAQAAARARDVAMASAEAAERRLGELILLRDAIPAVQAEADGEQLMADRIAAVLADLLSRIGTLRQLIVRAQPHGPFGPVDPSAVPSLLNELAVLINFVDQVQAPVILIQESLQRLRSLFDLARRQPWLDPGVAGALTRELEMLPPTLERVQVEAASRAAGARDRVAELLGLTHDLPAIEAEAMRARAEANGLALRAHNAQAALEKATTHVQALRTTWTQLNTQYRLDLDSLIGSVDTRVPLALLPIRLETRFRPRQQEGAELLIRIYPDDVHQDTHEPELTKDEFTWGRHCWEQIWRVGTTESAEQKRGSAAAWSQLAERFGPARATWIFHKLEPKNRMDRPAASTPDDQLPDPMPDILEPASFRSGSWGRSSHTRVLPDRWVALGYRSGGRDFVAWGDLIPNPLDTGPDPAAMASTDVVDEGMRWMVDFEEAVKKGMGIRVPLSPGQARFGFDKLIVLGVKATLDAAASAGELAGLLNAHHYTWGLGLVPQGTPTNNTPEAKSAYAGRNPGNENSFALECGEPLFTADDGSDGDLLARALGLDPAIFAHVNHANGRDQQDAASMNAVMWPATWRYFLSQMMAGTIPGGDFNRWRRYFIATVRARGPLPALRVGRQPYGLLPVTSLDRMSPPQLNPEQMLFNLLKALRGSWRNSLDSVPCSDRLNLGTQKSDPDKNIVEMLAMDALSSSYRGRNVLGPQYTDMIWWFLGKQLLNNWRNRRDELTSMMLKRLALAQGEPLLSKASFAVEDFDITGPLVQDEPVSETEPLNENYIEWLRSASPKDIHDQAYRSGAPAPKALLFRLLRHATLQAYADAAFEIAPNVPFLKEPELVDLSDLTVPDPIRVSRTLTSWRNLSDGPNNGGQNRDLFLLGQLNQNPQLDTPPVAELREFLSSLEALGRLPTAALERLLSESLDLSSHRLDAWITSCATQRLSTMRQRGPGGTPIGIQLGGYGWVEHLKPASSAASQNTGFIHAPSLAHATTAAILRSGYLSHNGSAKGDLLALDLSSRRVRLALSLLDGVRQSQPLGALLGYRFERGLHENHPDLELDKYIAVFRDLAPLAARKLEQTTEAADSIAARNVVDGSALLRRFQEGKLTRTWAKNTIPFQAPGLAFEPPVGGFPNLISRAATTKELEYNGIISELMSLEDTTDAISDVMTAESVYQAVQGNYLRSGASLDAIASGEVPPPEVEVVKTARSGVGLTHRVLVLFNGDAAPLDPQRWRRRPRADAEPHLNSWAAKLLGDPTNVLCRIEYLDPKTGAPLNDAPVRTVSLLELGLCPLDVVYASIVTENAQRSDLEQQLVHHALKTRPKTPIEVPPDAGVRLLFGRAPEWSSETVSFPEILEIARVARELIAHARAIESRDLAQPSARGSAEDLKLSELIGRANKAVDDLTAARRALERDLASGDAAQLQTALLQVAAFDIPGAVPMVAGESSVDLGKLQAQAKVVVDTAGRKLKNIDDATKAFAEIRSPTARIELDYHLGRLSEIFGRAFRVLPLCSPRPGTAADQIITDLKEALERRRSAKDAEPPVVIPWFQRVARIRAGAARLDRVLMFAEAIGAGDSLSFQVAQLPRPSSTQGSDRWVGVPASTIPRGRLSLVAHTPSGLDLGKAPSQREPLAGLLVDEWVEVVPNRNETTAVTFHYDAPGACAPQAILLAVPPDPTKPWDLDTLEAVLLETLELAKLRAVDPDALNEVGHYLPALFFAHNVGGDPNGDTVATSFRST